MFVHTLPGCVVAVVDNDDVFVADDDDVDDDDIEVVNSCEAYSESIRMLNVASLLLLLLLLLPLNDG